MSNINVGKVVKLYQTLRASRAKLDAEHKAAVAPIDEQLKKVEAFLLESMTNDGVTQYKTEYGTAFRKKKESATVSDWEATWGFILEREAWDFLEKRVTKKAVLEYMEEHGVPPPGVSVYSEFEVQVRKPTNQE